MNYTSVNNKLAKMVVLLVVFHEESLSKGVYYQDVINITRKSIYIRGFMGIMLHIVQHVWDIRVINRSVRVVLIWLDMYN